VRKTVVKRRVHHGRCFSLRAIDWKHRPGRAKDIAVGADDAIWVVGSSGHVFRWNGRGWSQIGSRRASRICVQGNGRPYMVGADGNLYRWHCVFWQRVYAPKAQDIGCDAKGAVYITGRNQAIYRQAGRKWIRVTGSAVRVSVGKDGLWVVNRRGNVFRSTTHGRTWAHIPGKRALDVGAGPEGSVYITGTRHGIFKRAHGKWHDMGGRAVSVAVGKGGRPFVVNRRHYIYWPVNRCISEKLFEYWVYYGGKTWFQAEATCRRWGGHLASIRQVRERARIISIMKLQGVRRNAWIAGIKRRGRWQWADGERRRYWPTERNFYKRGHGNCAAMNVRSMRYASQNCYHRQSFVCKRPIGGKAPGYIPGKQCPRYGKQCPHGKVGGSHMTKIMQSKRANWLSHLEQIDFCMNRQFSHGRTLGYLRFRFGSFDHRIYQNYFNYTKKVRNCRKIRMPSGDKRVRHIVTYFRKESGLRIVSGFSIKFSSGKSVRVGRATGDRQFQHGHNWMLIGFGGRAGAGADAINFIFNACPAKAFNHNWIGHKGKHCSAEDYVQWKNRTERHRANDIAVGGRSTWMVGTNGRVYKRFGNRWGRPAGHNASRIAVTPKGRPWIVARNHVVKQLVHGKW